jgi:hypothetical protein
MAKKKAQSSKKKKGGGLTQRAKDDINLAKIGVAAKTENISQFVKTNLKEIKKNTARRLIDDVLIPFSLLTSRIDNSGMPVGRTVRVRNNRVYQIVAEDIRSLIDGGVSIYDPQTDDTVALLFLLDELINSGGKARVESEQTQKQAEKEKKDEEKEERAKARTAEIARKKQESEQARKEEEKKARDTEEEERRKTEELRQEAEAKVAELRTLEADLTEDTPLSGATSTSPSVPQEPTVKIQIVKKIEKKIEEGSENSLKEVSEIDEKQDDIDINDGGLSQVPQEQPITQAQENADLQEQQLEENVNDAAALITEASLFVQEDQNERDVAQEQQVEPIESGGDDFFIDFLGAVSNKTAELLSGEETEISEEEKKAIVVKTETFDQYWLALDVYLDNLKLLKRRIKESEPYDDIMSIILDIRDELYIADEARTIRSLRENIVGVARGSVGEEDNVRAMRVIAESIRQLLAGNSNELQNLVDIAETNRRTLGLEEKQGELRGFLERTQRAIDEIKEQVAEDGLVIYEGMPPMPLTGDAILIQEAIVDMTDEIEEKKEVSQPLLDKFVLLFRVLKIDTQQVIIQALQNSVLEGDIFGFGSRSLSGILLRFMGRLLYNNVSIAESDSALEAFIESGLELEGRDETVVAKLIQMLKIVIPEPPEIVVEPVLFRREISREQIRKRRKFRMENRARLSATLSRDLKRGYRSILNPNVGGLFSSIVNKARGVFGKQTEFEMKEMKSRDIEAGEAKEEKEEIDVFEEDFEELVGDLESGARTAALAAAASARSPALGLEEFIKEVGDFVDVNILPDPSESGFARNIVARRPNFLADVAGNIGARVAPIFRRNREYRSIPTARLVKAIVAGLLAVFVQHFIPEQEEEQERQPETQRQGVETTEAKRPKGAEFVGSEEKGIPVEDIDKPVGEPLLRPDFFNLGTDYFDKLYNVPLRVQNNEWSQFDFVPYVDRQNNIELDNIYGDGIRFSGDMYYPKYQAPVAPPSRRAVIRTRDTLAPVIQLSQGMAPKFSGAVTPYDNLSYVVNHDEFSRSWRDQVLYYPDNSI